MKLEQQVVSLELAKKLKELGVPQESLFWHVEKFPIFSDKDRITTRTDLQEALDTSPLSDEAKSLIKYYSAYTVAELGEITEAIDPDLIQSAYNYVFNVDGSRFITATGLQLLLMNPNRCAKMLIYLIENNIISTKEFAFRAA